MCKSTRFTAGYLYPVDFHMITIHDLLLNFVLTLADAPHLRQEADKISQLETDVELHKRIVAAAERLAKDKSMNKSVRKKRQKDLAAAAMKLRGLELGLTQMRLSASKPDVSSLESSGSGGSWAALTQGNGNSALTRAVAKSCPTTPRGSVPDLCPSNGEKSDYEDDEPVQPRAPSSTSRRSLHQRFSEASTSSNGSLGLPPRANSRRSITTRSITSDELDNPLINALPVADQAPIYENIGYRSTSYRSSYRQAHYPTLQDEQHLRKRALSAHSISQTDVPNSISYTTRIENSFQFKQAAKTNIPEDDDLTPTIEHPEPLRRLPTSFSCQAGFSTASLDRRAIIQRPSPSSSNGALASARHMQQFSASPSRGHSPSAHRITTFPVCTQLTGGFDRKPYSSSDLPRFQTSINRPVAGFAPHGSQPSRGIPGSSSAGKLPARPDPHMEALLDYYKGQSGQAAAPKTATIV
ncbi:hypothetical protein Y032_0051g2150 [Ancylostoma ceylanicum]|uniref:Cytohesin Ubiquitin Protein Inducing domain-containing protein n=1 Tax=Ancylostoma ceylanicum TaxID=53326 RepID=A0A016U827_9BILA|nr:hypothetical protein Y032_0051g2150 [Ancylostoma ceylanicum]